jgi:hypothetical protein
MTRTLSTSRTSSTKVLCDTQETRYTNIIDTIRVEPLNNWEQEICPLLSYLWRYIAFSLKVCPLLRDSERFFSIVSFNSIVAS